MPKAHQQYDQNWQRDLSRAVRTSQELLRRLGLPLPGAGIEHSTRPESVLLRAADKQSSYRSIFEFPDFPVLVPESFLRRMQPGNPDDPLLLQVLPQPAENDLSPGFMKDAVGDLQARRAPGLLQKYAGRALLIAAGACAVHCRYCFRRDYPYGDDPKRIEDWGPAISEIAADPSIREVLLSGGDPLMLNDSILQQLCGQLDAIPHVERIRVHSRLPIVLPSRITSELLLLLLNLRAQAIFVVHANHPAEVQDDCSEALRRLVRSGIPVLNQAVLLRNINDSADVLEELSRRLINLGVIPYYLHQLDRVHGTAHFEVPEDMGRRLINELSARLPGYAVPQYVREIPGNPGKTKI